ncbi:GNAT family N-acetyltransferase [Daejeonella sp. JGW-45]|uniref:GNAT family N-acetyltransferase n=1 Tax=Daejeonella sp. JGW-45 TaxID=3034148 RepID=UPI0023EC0B97|nr:GNAT family N-acetyltransferase [Daejeonella sp. JGW-45]
MFEISFRIANFSDLPEMQQLFVDTVRAICRKDYNDEQIQAWISGVKDTQRWRQRLDEQHVLLALTGDQITAFGTIKDGNYIDMFFVHKDFQGQGIAGKIYSELEDKARELNSDYIDSKVSITARPFFEKMGFLVLAEQTVKRMGVELVNYRMRKMVK